jgi:drug/metabolite transporter (DMT)-like permease
LTTTVSTNNANKNAITAWLLLLLLALVWGMSFILIKKVTHVYSATELGAGRIFIAALTLLPWAIRGRKNYQKEKTVYFILSGLLAFLLPAFIFGYVGSRINSSLSGTLNSTTPIFTLLIGVFFFSKALHKNQVFGIVLGFIGSLFLVLSGSQSGDLDFSNPYALLVVLATVMYGFNANIVGTFVKDLKAVELTAFTLLVVGVISFVILFFFTDFFPKSFDSHNHRELLYLILLGSINSALAVVIYNYVLQITNPLFSSSVTYLIPIVATIVGFLDGESISFLHYFGMAIILVGVYLINKK